MNSSTTLSPKHHRYTLRARHSSRRVHQRQHQSLTLYYAYFCVKINHHDSETLFDRVWLHMSSLKQYEAIIEGYGRVSMQLAVPSENVHLMLITSDHSFSMIKLLIDHFLMEMKLSALDNVNDREHCQMMMHCQKSIDQGLLGGLAP